MSVMTFWGTVGVAQRNPGRDDAGLAGNVGHDPLSLVGREPRVDPAHGGGVGGHCGVD